MKLAGTQDLLKKLATLERRPITPVADESRQAPRAQVRGEAELQPLDRHCLDRSPVDVAIRDISRTGLGFVAVRPFAVNSLWRCGFVHRSHIVSYQALEIRHCTEVAEGIYQVGAQFVADPAVLMLLDADL